MIELSSVGNKSTNLKNKTTSKETSESTSFEDFIKLMGVNKEGDATETEQQNFVHPLLLGLPVSQSLLSSLVNGGMAGNAPNNSNLSSAISAEMVLAAKQQALGHLTEQQLQQGAKGASGINAALLEQIVNQAGAISDLTVSQQKSIQQGLTALLHQGEQGLAASAMPNHGQQESVKQLQATIAQAGTVDEAILQQADPQLREQLIQQLSESILGQQQEAGSLSEAGENSLFAANRNTPTPPLQAMIDSTGKLVFETPVRATQLDTDISKLLQSAIDVQNLKDGIEATFSLKPEHLGKVDVKVTIQDGNVIAEFLTNSLSGKDLLESQVQVLRMALEQQGFQVDKINISQQQNNMSGAFSQKGDSQARQGQQESKKREGQSAYLQEEDYWDHSADSTGVSRINTTA